jgi:hypothetical protein
VLSEYLWVPLLIAIVVGVGLHFAYRSSMFGPDSDERSPFDESEDRIYYRRRRKTRVISPPGSVEDMSDNHIPEGVSHNVAQKLLDAPIDLESRDR